MEALICKCTGVTAGVGASLKVQCAMRSFSCHTAFRSKYNNQFFRIRFFFFFRTLISFLNYSSFYPSCLVSLGVYFYSPLCHFSPFR